MCLNILSPWYDDDDDDDDDDVDDFLIFDSSKMIRAASWENLLFHLRKQRRRSAARLLQLADQHLYFLPLRPISEVSSLLVIFCGCTARFVLDWVRNPENRFSHNAAHNVLVPDFIFDSFL